MSIVPTSNKSNAGHRGVAPRDFNGGTSVMNAGVVQRTCQFGSGIYAEWKRVRASPAVKGGYIQVYEAGDTTYDLAMNQGEIAFMLTKEHAAAGGMQSAMSQQPVVATSLNMWHVKRSDLEKAYPMKKGNFTVQDALNYMSRMIRVVGICSKTIHFQPDSTKPRDSPILWTKGPMTSVNIGPHDLYVGMTVMAEFPPVGYIVPIMDTRNGLSRTKVTMMPVPFKNRGKAWITIVRERFLTTKADFDALVKNPTEGIQKWYDNRDGKGDGKELDEYIDYLPHDLLQFAKYITFVTLLGQGIADDVAHSAVFENTAPAVQLMVRGTPYNIDLDTYLRVMISADEQLHFAKQYGDVARIPEKLLDSLGAALAADKARILGVVGKSGKRGMRYDLDASKPAL